MSYANAKFFHLYRDYFTNLYSRDWKSLFDLNFETLKQTIQWLGLKTSIIRESELTITGKANERLINICKAVGADTYMSGRGAGSYIDGKQFENNNLRLEFQDYAPKPYPQHLSKSFIPDLSILDLLANVGPNSLNLIRESSSNNPDEDNPLNNFAPNQ
jgi:hypothetical protein